MSPRSPTPEAGGLLRAARRRDVLRFMGRALGAAGFASLAPLAGRAGEAGRTRAPNVVVIMTDDQGYQDLGCYGSPDIVTPHIDRLAAEGIRFTDFYAAPQCTAARIAFMTGSYAARAGDLKRTGLGTRVGIHEGEQTIAEVLRGQGYATHLVGKWHLGMAPAFAPTRHGFDTFFGMLTSNGQNPALMRGETVLEAKPEQSTLTERYTAEAIGHIERAGDRPFFLFLSHVMPHVPLSVSPRFQGQSERGLYGDAVQCIDWSTGRVMAALAESDVEADTLVVFCSDNGPWRSKGRDGGSAAPFRGGKGQVLEGGVRVPGILRYPRRVAPGRTSSRVCGLIDLLPTFAELAGAPMPEDRTIDGRSLVPLIEDTQQGPVHDAFYFFKGSDLAAVRRGPWKYYLARSDSGTGRLYDIRSDPGETRDMAAARPEVVRTAERSAQAFAAQLAQTRRPPGRV